MSTVDLDTKPELTRPSIMRIARRAGVKSISDDCYAEVRKLVDDKLKQVVDTALIVNSERHTKTIMTDDVYDAFSLLGHNVGRSNDLGTKTCAK